MLDSRFVFIVALAFEEPVINELPKGRDRKKERKKEVRKNASEALKKSDSLLSIPL